MTSTPPLPEQHPSFTFLRALHGCRELSAAVARYAGGSLYHVQRALASGLPTASTSGPLPYEDDICHGTATVAKLVLKELDATEHQFTCQPTEEGLAVLAALQRAVFGPDSLQQSFTQRVYLASLAQAAQALELVTAALLDVVSTHNCLSLFSVAGTCGCAPLRRAARALALRAFSAAMQQDVAGLLTLAEPDLLALLCSDSLQVDSEFEVFQALAAWTEYDAPARKPQLAARMARCLRLDALTIPDVTLIDDHPLVASDRQALQLNAQVFMHLSVGMPLECPLGFHTTPRLRLCQRAGANGAPAAAPASAAAGEEAQCGLAAHAGQHSSVFEAAVCGFARQRQQRADAAAEAAAAADMRRLSVGAAGDAGACPGASPAAARLGPRSPLAHAPTPPNANLAGQGGAAAAAAAEAPAVQPTARVRHFGIGKRVASRRSLFDMAAGGASSSAAAQPQLDATGPKSPADTTAALAPAAAPRAGASWDAGAGMVAGVSLEMQMSPSHASVRGLLAQAQRAAAEPQPAGWEGRKRLRFD